MSKQVLRLFFFLMLLPLYALHAATLSSDSRVSVTDVDHLQTAAEFYQSNPEKVGMIPDGTGLQILFHTQNHYYLIAGPRSGRLLTANGGKIENQKAPFLTQLQEEYDEETFGLMKLSKRGNKLVLIVNNKSYPLKIHGDKTLIVEKPGQFAYVTFTAVVEGMELQDIKALTNKMNPTALFWERIGSFLFAHVRNAPKDEQFAAYWLQQQPALNQFLSEQTEIYDRLMQDKLLLITPEQAFNTKTLEAAWEALRNLNSFAQLKNCFQNTVGRYSERKGYYDFDAEMLLKEVEAGAKTIVDINGDNVAQGVFNLEAITQIFPLILFFD